MNFTHHNFRLSFEQKSTVVVMMWRPVPEFSGARAYYNCGSTKEL
jgi:hypothetical protein